ncbi:MAG: hypothetical protein Q8807_03700, partial ['Waltheria sp.' little leaf phytoplasma]|nr:hypothetical protein ['Waltheria sp.' little leaf phytoplasma]
RAENTFLAQDIKDLTNNKILFSAGTFLNYEDVNCSHVNLIEFGVRRHLALAFLFVWLPF